MKGPIGGSGPCGVDSPQVSPPAIASRTSAISCRTRVDIDAGVGIGYRWTTPYAIGQRAATQRHRWFTVPHPFRVEMLPRATGPNAWPQRLWAAGNNIRLRVEIRGRIFSAHTVPRSLYHPLQTACAWDPNALFLGLPYASRL